MSDSRAKYEELEHKADNQPHNQRSLHIILGILRVANKADLVDILIDKAMTISKSAPKLSPLVVLQLAADEAKVDELCN